MPYTSTKSLPTYVKRYSPVIQRQWMHVFNRVYNKLAKTASTTNAEKRAFMAANSVLKKRFKEKKSMEKNSRDDYFIHLVDNWLNNLNG